MAPPIFFVLSPQRSDHKSISPRAANGPEPALIVAVITNQLSLIYLGLGCNYTFRHAGEHTTVIDFPCGLNECCRTLAMAHTILM